MQRLCALAVSLMLSGCVTVLSVPLDETLNLMVTGYSELVAGSTSDRDPCTLRYPLRSVCIEYNQHVASTDFLPSLRRRLGQLQVESTLHAPGTQPLSCEATLRYVASRNWSSHFASSDKSAYLDEADLFLYQQNRMLASAHYQISRWGYEKWTSTSTKIDPVVDELLCQPGK